MFDALFEALFSYRPVVFREGDFRFDVTSASLVATLVVGVVVAAAIFTYRRVQVADGRVRDRVILTTLRVAALGLVLFCLFRPTAGRAGGGQPAERRRGAARRLPQHADSRPRRESARHVRQRRVWRSRQPDHESAVGSVPRAPVPFLIDRHSCRVRQCADLRWFSDQAWRSSRRCARRAQRPSRCGGCPRF